MIRSTSAPAFSRIAEFSSTNRLVRPLFLVSGLLIVALGTSFAQTEIRVEYFQVWGIQISWTALAPLVLLLGFAGLLFTLRGYVLIQGLAADDRRLAIGLLAAFLIFLTGFFASWFDEGLLIYEFRDNFGFAVAAVGTAMVAMALPRTLLPDRLVEQHATALVALSAFVALGVGIIISALVMKGLPHCHDSFTYLMQGRFFWAYGLETPHEPFPELFSGRTGLRMGQGENGFAGRYPLGWPIILGAVDEFLGAPWLASPLMAAGLVFATFLMMKQIGSREFAALTACVMGLSPWLAISSGDQLSHLATTLGLVLFMAGYYALQKDPRIIYGVGAGLGLALAVAIRAQDAFIFALPVVVTSFAYVRRDFWRRLPALAMLSVCALAAVASYFGYNYIVTGDPFLSSYYVVRTVQTTSTLPVPTNIPDFRPLHFLVGLHERLSDVQRIWFVGTSPLIVFVIYGFFRGRLYWQSAGLFLAGSLLIALVYGGVINLGRTWLDPRGFVPLIPAISILLAAGLRAAVDDIKGMGDGILRGVAASLLVGWLIGLPMFLGQQLVRPPHGIDNQLVNAVRAAGISNAVVGLPLRYNASDSPDSPSYKIPLDGLWTMQVPFEINDVVYVGTVGNWEPKARARFPGRRLYELNRKSNDFSLIDVPEQTAP